MPYLIDGHNLIHYLPDIRLDDPHDEAKLVLKLRGFCARTGKKCVVVFDEGLPGGTSSLSTPSVKVVFATSRQSNADRIIRERIRHERDVKGWVVISSDNEILDDARSVGMRGQKSAKFAERLQRIEAERPHEGLQEHVTVSEGEIEEWLTAFDIGDTSDDVQTSPDLPAQPRQSQPAVSSEPEVAPTLPEVESPKPKPVPSKPRDKTGMYRNAGGQTDAEIDRWIEVFGEEPAVKPTDQRPPRRPKRKKQQDQSKQPGELAANEALKADETSLSDNSVEAWMQLFGGEEEVREPTDPAPQRFDPKKQGRYKSHDGKRQPTVHKRMATSDEIYLSDGEVDAWMDVFGVDEDNEEE